VVIGTDFRGSELTTVVVVSIITTVVISLPLQSVPITTTVVSSLPLQSVSITTTVVRSLPLQSAQGSELTTVVVIGTDCRGSEL
jgi:hypothetical protein